MTNQMTSPSTSVQSSRKLMRSRSDHMLSGVCGGMAAYTGVDATLIRAAVAIATVLGFGSLILVYIVLWIALPTEP